MNLNTSLKHLQIEGYCVIEGIVSDKDLLAIRREIKLVMTARGEPDTYKGVTSAFGVLDSIPTFVPYLANRRVLDIAKHYYGPHLRISYTSSMITEPGNERGRWHADWPYNQEKAAKIPAPYPDFPVQLSSIWMISNFTEKNGGTWIVPGSHHETNNPTGDMNIPLFKPYPTEKNATGTAGSVLLFDSRLWHATATNHSDKQRISMIVRYIPWWLNTSVLMPGSQERWYMVEEPGLLENEIPAVTTEVYQGLPKEVKPLYRHWVRNY